ncbi:hypothetical protein ACH5RR_008517 [Cinchona calisaya]|uniref:Uncharacterized protein n=1 Tax=Cinchona calisaya TaxID=153742 RepID=A0ABD3AF72_9GENT
MEGNNDVNRDGFKTYSDLFSKWREDAGDSNSLDQVNVVDNEIQDIAASEAHESVGLGFEIKDKHVFDEMFQSHSIEMILGNNCPMEIDEIFAETSFDLGDFISEIENERLGNDKKQIKINNIERMEDELWKENYDSDMEDLVKPSMDEEP